MNVKSKVKSNAIKKERVNNQKPSSRRKAFSAYNMYNYYFGTGGGGGAYEGAKSNRFSRHWNYSSGTADSEVLGDLSTLRERSRDLFRNNSIGRGAIGTMASNVIGCGLQLQSVIDRDYLGLDDEKADEWENNVERKFNNWASSVDCDAARSSDFFDLQDLAYSSYLQSGECFVLLPILNRNNRDQLCIQLIEADMVQNAPGQYNSINMRDGITVDEFGAPTNYNIRTGVFEWKSIPAYGEKTGRRNVCHVYKQERPGQTRGVPFLAPVIENIKELGRYNKSELAAAVISSMFTVFIHSNNEGALKTPIDDDLDTSTNATTEDDFDYTLAPGAVYRLEDGEQIETANPMRPNTAYEQFISAQLREIGMALQIPYEILCKQFLSSYSASRASRIEAYRFFLKERSRFARKFCQVIYEEWLTEEILNMRIPAFGFIEDYDTKKAWCGTQWIGEVMGEIDESKGVKAAADRVDGYFSTRTQETIQMNGGDFMKNIRKQIQEAKAILELQEIKSKITGFGTEEKPEDNKMIEDDPDEEDKAIDDEVDKEEIDKTEEADIEDLKSKLKFFKEQGLL